MFVSKQVKETTKVYLKLCMQDGQLDQERIKAVVKAIAENEKSNAIAILTHLKQLIHLELNNQTAKVESALALPADTVQNISATLEKKYNRKLFLEVKENADLIGGFKVTVGSDVFDYTTKNKLVQLKKILSS